MFLKRRVFAPRGLLAMSGDRFGYTTHGCYLHLVGSRQHASKHSRMSGLIMSMLAKMWNKRTYKTLVEVKSISLSLKNSLAVSYNVKCELIISENSVDSYLPMRNENVCPCIAMFIAVFILFRLATNQKEFKCPSTGKWINRLWHICVMEYFN